jgi:hypothetical protein
VLAWITYSRVKPEDFLFPSRIHASPHLSTRQNARIVESWVHQLGLDVRYLGIEVDDALEMAEQTEGNQWMPVGGTGR